MTDLNVIHLYEPKMATGDEKALLRTHLALAQRHLLWKLEGLSDDELRRPMTRTSTNLIGIVKHLTGVTAYYLVSSFGRAREFFDQLMNSMTWIITADSSQAWKFTEEGSRARHPCGVLRGGG